MKNHFFSFLLMGLFSLLALPVLAQDDVASDGSTGGTFEQDVIKLFEVSNSTATYKAVIPQLFSQFKAMNNKVSAEVWAELEKEMASDISELQKMLIPVYQKHFTQSEIRAITAFYETPAGRKFAEKQVPLSQESMQVGQTWGQFIGQKVAEKLKAKGY